MPIYEFYCPRNNRIYSFLARSLALSGKTPRCPDDPDAPMERLISTFAVTGRARETVDAPPGDPAAERMMSELEREFSGMDESNPDPRQLAQMMRKMAEATGEKMPAGMEEMMRRMAAGEDPEKLEAEYGGAFDEMDSGSEEPDDDAGAAARRHRRAPERDPVLYEMSEYVT